MEPVLTPRDFDLQAPAIHFQQALSTLESLLQRDGELLFQVAARRSRLPPGPRTPAGLARACLTEDLLKEIGKAGTATEKIVDVLIFDTETAGLARSPASRLVAGSPLIPVEASGCPPACCQCWILCPNSSYLRRLSASPNTSYASFISLNLDSAVLSFGLTSGWYWRANFRYAFLISFSSAFLDTPRT